MALQGEKFLGVEETASVIYHDIFDYPLNTKEIIKWGVGKKGLSLFKKTKEIINKDGYYFLKGKENILYKKTLRERASEGKIKIAEKNASVLAKLPGIKGVFVTGALSMNNAEEESDIDLMIFTKKNYLWTTRLFTYLLLKIINISVRKPKEENQKDKLCLNIWLDESALSWNKKDRNIYSAHEIAQVIPIVNKDNIYQTFLQKNSWILDYWPNSVRIEDVKNKSENNGNRVSLFENLSFWLQYKYMNNKITEEKVSLHKAIFHPRNWSKIVLDRLNIY
jgi:predicted nucleotidyltransferase